VSDSVLVLWDEALLGYNLGRDHPLHPVRLELTVALARELGVLDRPGVRVAKPQSASDALLELVHDSSYLNAVRRAPDDMMGRLGLRYGLGTDDNPVFERMHESSALITGATLDAARAVHEGTAQHAVNLAGGLHHAMRDRASGFCVYNDPAVAIAWLLTQGVSRIAYVDIDAHHGDGVQAAFYVDPRVLTISLHESGYTLFPGTGFPTEIGGGEATGSAVNVALPAGTADGGWLRAFHAVVPPLLREFRPEIMLSQHGCDSHRLDPLADLMLTVDGQQAAHSALHDLAHEICGGRWIAVGGGGYEVVQVVPRSWTQLLAVATGGALDPSTEVPPGWREFVATRSKQPPPALLGDGTAPSYSHWEPGEGDVDSPLDLAVAATRRAVWPLHGLDPVGQW
jgi:acetoin utilization protein AcuC